jgi:hypothetical protein
LVTHKHNRSLGKPCRNSTVALDGEIACFDGKIFCMGKISFARDKKFQKLKRGFNFGKGIQSLAIRSLSKTYSNFLKTRPQVIFGRFCENAKTVTIRNEKTSVNEFEVRTYYF